MAANPLSAQNLQERNLNALFRAELITLLLKEYNGFPESQETFIENTTRFYNAFIGQPFYVISSLLRNEMDKPNEPNQTFKIWLLKIRDFLSTLFSNVLIFNSEYQKKIQPLIDLLYYFNKADETIPTLLYRLETIKLLKEMLILNSDKNYELFYDRYFKENMDNLLHNNKDDMPSVSFIIKTAFDNCLAEESFNLNTSLEIACFIAWLIPHIEENHDFSKLSDQQYKDMADCLKEILDKHFSPQLLPYIYSGSNSPSKDLAGLCAKANEMVIKRLKYIHTLIEESMLRDPESQQEIGLKDFLLQLFSFGLSPSFFAHPYQHPYQIVNILKNTAEVYIDWYEIIENLLTEDPSKAQELSEKINSFIEIWEKTLASRIPELSEIDARAEKAAGKEEEKESAAPKAPSSPAFR